MNKGLFLLLASSFVINISCNDSSKISQKVDDQTIRIMFGSCLKEYKPMPLLDIAAAQQPDVFIFLGDNIYGDSREMDTLRAKYDRLRAHGEFQRLTDNTRTLAVWDDHDFGENDAGRHYPLKEESKEIFLDFWKVSDDSPRRSHAGIYGAEYLSIHDMTVQFVLLDTRTFRDNLRLRTDQDTSWKNDYVPYETTDSTFLGEDQWAWLEQTLRAPADLRIIASSNQFSHTYNGWESWTNVPHERQRFIDLIQETRAEHVIFISGDVHWGEISRQDVESGYPLYDVTSSGITETWPNTEPNTNRVGNVVRQNNVAR